MTTIEQDLEAKKAEYEKLSKQIDSIEAGPVRLELKKRRNALTGEMVNLRQTLISEQIQIALAGGTPKNIPTLQFGK